MVEQGLRINLPPQRSHRIQFSSETDFMQALQAAERLARRGPMEYDTISDGGDPETLELTLPHWSYKLLKPALRRKKLNFEEVPGISRSRFSLQE